MKSPVLFLSFALLLAVFLVEGCATRNSPSNRSVAGSLVEKERFAKKEMIQVEMPQPGTLIRSP